MKAIESFNGDTFIQAEIRKIVNEFGIKTIIETGTYQGNTTLDFATMVKKVFTIEVNETYYNLNIKKFIGKSNIVTIRNSSPKGIEQIISGKYGIVEKPILFYLDAHWGAYNPLLDEFEMIKNFNLKPIIAIHDFKVPDKDFGFDKFSDGTPYTYEFIEPHIKKIYGTTKFKYYYNDQATGSNRGIIYITPEA